MVEGRADLVVSGAEIVWTGDGGELAGGWVACTGGRISAVGTPSVQDPSLRTGDGTDHVLSLEVLWTPYDLAGGWAGSPEPERWLGFLDTIYGAGTVDRVRRWRVMTPPDYERDFGLVRGHAPSFPGGPLAALRARDP